MTLSSFLTLSGWHLLVLTILMPTMLSSISLPSLGFGNNIIGTIKKTTDMFERIQYYETVTLKHSQLHKIDDEETPLYPLNGIIKFDAFGHHYRIWIRKHVDLLDPDFKSGYRDGDSVRYKSFDNCHYLGEVTSDNENPTVGAFSVCKGRGMQGWIHAFNETIVIRPYKLLADGTYKGKHRLDDKHIVYKYDDVDRSDYPHNKGSICAHGHQMTETLDNRVYEKRKSNFPDGLPWLATFSNSTRQNQRRLTENNHNDHNHNHNHNKIQNKKNDDDIISNPFGKHAKDVRSQIRRKLADTNQLKIGNKKEEVYYYEGQNRRRLTSSTTYYYVQLVIMNDPGRVTKWKETYTDSTWEAELLTNTIDICNTLSTYYLDTDWGTTVGTIQVVLTYVEHLGNWTNLTSYMPESLVNSEATDAGTYCSGCYPDLYDSSLSG